MYLFLFVLSVRVTVASLHTDMSASVQGTDTHGAFMNMLTMLTMLTPLFT